MAENNIYLTVEEIQAVQKLLGFVLYHTSPELYSVADKLEKFSNPDAISYDDVVFFKNDDSGSPIKPYKHQNISIGINS